jgi:uncharacterized protein
MYKQIVTQYIKMLGNLSTMIDKAESFATTKKFDVKVLLNARLAPDMYPFIRQIQVACDSAKASAARLAGIEPPRHEDNEQTADELRQRIHKTIQFLQTLKPDSFRDAEKRKVAIPWMEGKYVIGEEYLNELAIPNFYFHVTAAYSILRHNGLDVGKADYIGSIKFHDL